MADDIRVTGQENFRQLARRLRAQGETGKGLRRQLNKALDLAARPLIADVKRAEDLLLPQRGGLARQVSSSPVTVSKTMTGIRLRQRGKTIQNLTGEDRGVIRHPVFGNRKVWVSQKVTAGTWTDTLNNTRNVHLVRAEMLKAMDQTAKKIEG